MKERCWVLYEYVTGKLLKEISAFSEETVELPKISKQRGKNM